MYKLNLQRKCWLLCSCIKIPFYFFTVWTLSPICSSDLVTDFIPVRTLSPIYNSDIVTDFIPVKTLSPICSSVIVTHFIPVWTLSPICSSDIVTDFIPVCTLSPICSSVIVTDFPLSRVTCEAEGKQQFLHLQPSRSPGGTLGVFEAKQISKNSQNSLWRKRTVWF